MERHELTDEERRLWDACPSGEIVTFDDTSVRAEVIKALLLGAVPPAPGHYPGVRLRGARITGRLDLDGTRFDTLLDCGDCVFEDTVSLAEADLRTLRITGGHLPAFKAPRLRATGLLSLEGTSVERTLRLDHARLESEVRLTNVEAGRVQADNIEIQGTLDATGITVHGEFSVRGGQITGDLALTDGIFGSPSTRTALDGDAAKIGGRLRAENIRTTGRLLLRNAQIGSNAVLNRSHLSAPNEYALNAGGLTAAGGVFCGDGFTVQGGIRLIGAQLSGNLTLDDAKLDHPNGKALDLDSATCNELSGVRLHVTAGEISMRNTRIAGQANLNDAELNNTGGPRALAIDHAELGLVSLCRLRAHGEVMIRATRVKVRILLLNATLHNPQGVALRASNSEIGADLTAHDLTADGEVRLYGMRVGQHADLTGLRLSGHENVALNAHGLTAGELSLLPETPIEGKVVLTHARIGVLRDDPTRWPKTLDANGLTYEALEPRLPAKQRLTWLSGDGSGFESQPYEQLAAHYTALGLHADARKVLSAKERLKLDGETPLIGLWGRMQALTTGYGYQPWRSFLWLAALVTVGGVIYGLNPPAPLKADEAPHFNPVVYTLDLMIPIVDLGQQRAFNPAGAYQWLSYVFIAAGWVLATTIAAGVARTINRR
ncbi:hypothetical protein [Actinomadura hibisca]|uniref:hypothetical protein n=1 Tax=Actinomadura hibisca TaxID=68565 RepID=UPI0008299F50|nr:hypothetical protein [Actinomadura hibisca]